MKNLLYPIFIIIAVSLTARLSIHKESGSSEAIRSEHVGQTPSGDSARLFVPRLLQARLEAG